MDSIVPMYQSSQKIGCLILIVWSGGWAIGRKNGMTLSNMADSVPAALLRNYMNPVDRRRSLYRCTLPYQQAGRRSDVAYLTPELLAQFGNFNVLPQSFPLIAEIISPTDGAEEVFAKAKEYLKSGCQEILVLPESQWCWRRPTAKIFIHCG